MKKGLKKLIKAIIKDSFSVKNKRINENTKTKQQKPKILETDSNIILSILKNYPELLNAFKTEIKVLELETKDIPDDLIFLRAGQTKTEAESELSKRIKHQYKKKLKENLQKLVKTGDKTQVAELLKLIKEYK